MVRHPGSKKCCALFFSPGQGIFFQKIRPSLIDEKNQTFMNGSFG
jgi:hypothetical protein